MWSDSEKLLINLPVVEARQAVRAVIFVIYGEQTTIFWGFRWPIQEIEDELKRRATRLVVPRL